jgi:hypothetical protein
MMTRKEIENRKYTGMVVSHESEEITWLDDSVEDLKTVFGVHCGVFNAYGDTYNEDTNEKKDGGDLIESRFYDEESLWDEEE